jgi:hypothetical protein
MKIRSACAVVLGAAFALPAAAQETEPPPPLPQIGVARVAPPRFGLPGQVALSTDLRLSAIRSIATMGGGSSTDITLQPAADVFVASRLSVGAFLYWRLITSSSAPDTTIYGAEPRIGYSLPLSDAISFWPRVGAGFIHARQADAYNYQIRVSVRAHVLWHATPHLFVGVGPVFQSDVISKSQGMDAGKLTLFGLSSIVGGYFGGT